LPQPPQFRESVLVSAHAEAHADCPEGQVHCPPVHVCAAPHDVAQLPQLSGSVWRSTQLLPHAVFPVAHEAEHTPFEQT
jgi:hypothetical protein